MQNWKTELNKELRSLGFFPRLEINKKIELWINEWIKALKELDGIKILEFKSPINPIGEKYFLVKIHAQPRFIVFDLKAFECDISLIHTNENDLAVRIRYSKSFLHTDLIPEKKHELSFGSIIQNEKEEDIYDFGIEFFKIDFNDDLNNENAFLVFLTNLLINYNKSEIQRCLSQNVQD